MNEDSETFRMRLGTRQPIECPIPEIRIGHSSPFIRNSHNPAHQPTKDHATQLGPSRGF